MLLVPSNGPTVQTKKVGKFEAVLEWNPLSVEEQNGFIKYYTITYKTTTGNETGNHVLCIIFFASLLHIIVLVFLKH